MLIGTLFWALTALACGYSVASGGNDGRWAACLLVAASILTIPATRFGHAWGRTEWGVMVVDVALLIGLTLLMFRSSRYFPVWMVGFQLASVLSHLSTLLAPGFAPKIYRAVESLWALPITLSMVVGISRDRRAAFLRWGRGARCPRPPIRTGGSDC